MNDNTKVKKADPWVSLIVLVLILMIPGGIIAAWWFEEGAYLAITGFSFLIFAAGGAL